VKRGAVATFKDMKHLPLLTQHRSNGYNHVYLCLNLHVDTRGMFLDPPRVDKGTNARPPFPQIVHMPPAVEDQVVRERIQSFWASVFAPSLKQAFDDCDCEEFLSITQVNV
jgi:hypothetical protein